MRKAAFKFPVNITRGVLPLLLMPAIACTFKECFGMGFNWLCDPIRRYEIVRVRWCRTIVVSSISIMSLKRSSTNSACKAQANLTGTDELLTSWQYRGPVLIQPNLRRIRFTDVIGTNCWKCCCRNFCICRAVISPLETSMRLSMDLMSFNEYLLLLGVWCLRWLDFRKLYSCWFDVEI